MDMNPQHGTLLFHELLRISEGSNERQMLDAVSISIVINYCVLFQEMLPVL